MAVEIARKFNGEIINGDAMQLYEGLPIITNKISQDEMKGVPHHLLGRISLREETWTVGKFVSNALNLVRANKTPIVMGLTICRSKTFGVEARFRFWLEGLTIIRNHSCFTMHFQKSSH